MARPREWEHGSGSIPVLTPAEDALVAYQRGALPHAEYKRQYLQKVMQEVGSLSALGPGSLRDRTGTLIQEGDALCCACSREVARQGHCHRTWAASFLTLAGWEVRLDGVPLAPERARQLLRE